ncbi:MAG: EAL domain-containing protein, partial [Betaproteobacteria bacterium]
ARELILAAIERNEFTLLCQRIVPLAGSGGPVHFEILIRLLEEENNMIPPGAFFPLAEEHGLLPYLDRWVTANLMHWVAARVPKSAGDEHSLYFINISTATLRDPYFPSYVEQQLHKHELAGAHFCFEVAEDDVQSNRGDVEQFAKSVKAAGCKVALSGFGRGRIAVAMLKDLPLDFLKIDGGVIRTIQKDPLSKSKLVAVHKFAKTLGIVTVAEMVESDEITEIIRGIGVDYAQGFGIARPEPLA